MAETFLGIDVRADQAQCVQIRGGLKGRTVSGRLTIPLEANADLTEKARHIRHSLDEAGLSIENLAIGLPLNKALLRTLSFPFNSMTKIRKVAPFELDAQIPRPLAETVHSLLPTGTTLRENVQQQKILAAVIAQKDVQEYLDAFSDAGLSPVLLDIESSGINALARETEKKQSDRTLYLEIRSTRANLLYRRDNHLEFEHPLRFKAQQIIDTIAAHTGKDAQFVHPQQDAFNLASLESDTVNAITAQMEPFLDSLVRDINKILFVTQNTADDRIPQRLAVSGDLVSFPYFTRMLAERLSMPVIRLSNIQPYGDTQDKSAPHSINIPHISLCEDDTSMTALGLALRGLNPNDGFNFGSTKGKRLGDINWKKYLPFAAAAAVLLAGTWLFSIWTDISLMQNRLDALQAETKNVFGRMVPDKATNIPPRLYAQEAINRIDALRNTSQFSGSEKKAGMVSDLLRKISLAIPENLPVRIKELRIEGPAIRISAQADTFRTVDAVKEHLLKANSFTDVAVKGAKTAPGGKGVSFSLEIDTKENAS